MRNVEVLQGGEALELVRQRGEAIDVQIERVQRRQLAHLRWHLLQSVPVHVQLCTRHTRTEDAHTEREVQKKVSQVIGVCGQLHHNNTLTLNRGEKL
jgi:hypothetical protein